MSPELLRNGAILITDDAECIRILAAHSLLDKCRPVQNFNQASVAFDHEDHWCMATCHTTQDDGGYTICALPKSLFTEAEAARMFSEVLVETSDTCLFENVWARVAPETN